MVELPSIHGHDAFLTEPDAIGLLLSNALHNILMTIPSPTPRTRAVRASIASDPQHGAVVPPLHLSSTFEFAGFARPRRYDYTRSGNPTRSQLADALAELEGGAGAVVTNTGMSAATLALQLVRPSDTVLVAHDSYGGVQRLVRALAAKQHFAVVFTDFTAPNAAEEIRRARPRLVWIETPSNPLLRITDIQAISTVARETGALVLVDNTFLSPALQRPIALGADIVLHSTTKYLNGHSDVVGGAVIAAGAAVAEELGWWANCLGVTGAPFDSFRRRGGVRTVLARVALHLSNSRSVVDALVGHPGVRRVHYPGLLTHDGHAVAARQQSGFGAMVSFDVAGGAGGVQQLVERLELFTLAESLGGVESLIAHPATMTHASMTADQRTSAGISESLVRLSIGIESAEDLVADLCRALDAVVALADSAPAPDGDVAVCA
jgi:cystathionine gamma-synthase